MKEESTVDMASLSQVVRAERGRESKSGAADQEEQLGPRDWCSQNN